MHLSSLLCCLAHNNHPPSDSANGARSGKNSKKGSGSGVSDPTRLESLFRIYADEDDPSVVGPEGFERLCADAGLPLEGALPLILAWQFGASEMAKITRSEWDAGTTELR